MPTARCPIVDCDFITEDGDAQVIAVSLSIHGATHNAAALATFNVKKPDRPEAEEDMTEAEWNEFKFHFEIYKRDARIVGKADIIRSELLNRCSKSVRTHLFQLKGENLNTIIKNQLFDVPSTQLASPFSLSLSPPAANNTRKRKKNMGASLSRIGKTGRRRSLPETGVPEVSELKMPHRLAELLDMPEPPKATQELHGWNTEDKSVNISVKENDPTVVHRHPVVQSTDGVRTMTSYSRGLHAFNLTWRTRQRGTHALVGVATSDAAVHAAGYTALVGGDANSWGWDLGRSKACHDDEHSAYPATLSKEDSFVVPDKFVMVLDMDAGMLAFVVGGQYLGVAHTGLRGKKLFPIVSTVWGHCEISIKYQGGLEPEPLPLMNLCRQVVRNQISKENIQNGSLQGLNLPKSIWKYLEFKNCS